MTRKDRNMPLTLTRKVNEAVQIGNVTLQITHIGRSTVRLQFRAPREIPIRRLDTPPAPQLPTFPVDDAAVDIPNAH
jgi:hypothetical protein